MFHFDSIDDIYKSVPARLIATRPIATAPGETRCREAWTWMQPAAKDISVILLRGTDDKRIAQRQDSWADFDRTLGEVAIELPESCRVRGDARLGEAIEAILCEEFCLLENEQGELDQVVTLADLTRPASALWAFAVLMSLEEAITRLLPSLSEGAWMEGLARERREKVERQIADHKKGGTYVTDIASLNFSDKLELARKYIADPAAIPRKRFKKLNSLDKLRNDLAHGRPLGTSGTGGVRRAMEKLQESLTITEKLWELVHDRQEVWESMRETIVLYDSSSPTGEAWLVSAQNPGEEQLPDDANDERHKRLLEAARNKGLEVTEATGKSRSGPYQERMIVIQGDGACAAVARELARNFGKRAVFWVAGSRLDVLEATTGEIKATKDPYSWSTST